MDMNVELNRTRPDYVVYTPRSLDGSTHDTGNEHFLVFDGPDGTLMAVWTQSTSEGQPDHRIVFSKSPDEGQTWTDPMILAGPKPPQKGNKASWGFPLVSASGRIYVIWNQYAGIHDLDPGGSGWMTGKYSDDAGETWSDAQTIPMRRSTHDHPDPKYPANWIVWQRPERLSHGKYFVGFTRIFSPAVRREPPVAHWTAQESAVEFMRFENINDNPEPKDIQISWFACDDEALSVGFPGHPEVKVLQEPSLVKLPDGRLFCTMRSPRGNPYFSVSDDQGETWRAPEVIRRNDDGPELRHPCSPCPIYALGDGKYIFFIHNHDGHFAKWGPFDSNQHRRPVYLVRGEFQKHARQPIWFAEPEFFMDNDGVAIGYGNGRPDLSMYTSLTIRQRKLILWYPERKFFLLGKRIK